MGWAERTRWDAAAAISLFKFRSGANRMAPGEISGLSLERGLCDLGIAANELIEAEGEAVVAIYYIC